MQRPICQGALLSEGGSRIKATLNFQQAFDVEAARTVLRSKLCLLLKQFAILSSEIPQREGMNQCHVPGRLQTKSEVGVLPLF